MSEHERLLLEVTELIRKLLALHLSDKSVSVEIARRDLKGIRDEINMLLDEV